MEREFHLPLKDTSGCASFIPCISILNISITILLGYFLIAKLYPFHMIAFFNGFGVIHNRVHSHNLDTFE